MSTRRSSKTTKGPERKEKEKVAEDSKSVDDFLDKGFTVLDVGEVFKEAILLKVAGEFKRLFQSDAKHDKRYQNFIARDKDQLRFDFALSPRVEQKVLSLFPVRCVETIDRFAKKVLDEQDLKMQVRVFASLPGSRAQTWHRDAPRKKTFEAMNFFILLNEPDRDLGLTEIVPFSHLKGGGGTLRGAKPRLKASEVLAFDYAVMHRGLPNWSTGTVRYVLALVYTLNSFTDKNYSSRTRELQTC